MKLKKVNNSKGFTMVELLCATVILGIISVLAIKGISNLITRAKEEQFHQHERTLEIATESFLQANNQYKPKSIGEVKKIPISELKKSNYLKSDITNSKGESCMTNSYVRVYKLSKTEYTYLSYLYCGKEKVPSEETVPTPKLDAYYTDKDGTYAGVDDARLENTSAIKLVIKISGGETANGTEIELDGYNYVITKGDSLVVYDSGTLSANRNTSITINKDLSDYIKVNEENFFKVRVRASNIYGGYAEINNKIDSPASQVTLMDKTDPICESIINEPQDGEWINKTSPVKERTITVVCADGDGSGCVRDTFSKSWPNNEQNSTENGVIKIKDNAGNFTECNVKVLVDVESPTAKLDAYKAKKSGNNYSKSGSSVLNAERTTNNLNPTNTLNSTEYKNLYDGWMNKENYPNGIIYEVKVTDNLQLGTWTWETNQAYISEENTQEFAEVSGANPEAASGVFSNTEKPETIKIRLETQGKRKGVLTIKDIAGNEVIYTIYANIDTGWENMPGQPSYEFGCPIELRKYKSKTNPNPGDVYQEGTWSNLPVIVNASNCKVSTISGQGDYIFDVKLDGQSVTEIRQKSSRFDFYDQENPEKFEGSATVSVATCDKAGNCTSFSEEKIIKIDTIAPKCNVESTVDNKSYSGDWLASQKEVIVKATCSDTNGKITTSGCATTPFEKKYTTKPNTVLSITDAGAVGAGQGGQVSDKAGNVTICAADKKVQIDAIPPKCTVTAKTSGGTVYKGEWLKKGESLTITGTCSDNESGCDAKTKTISHEFNGNYMIDNAGPGGAGKFVTMKDNVGNETKCESNITIKIDQTPPTCTNSGDSTTWTNNSRTINWGCNDTGGSGCNPNNSGGSKTYETDTETASISAYTIKDNAGNTTSCPKRTANVYVDKTAPTCTNSGDSTTWTNANRTINWGCSDKGGSKCNSNNSGGSKTYTTDTETASISAYTIKDNAGNTTTCPERTANVYVDKTAPTCSYAGQNKIWTNKPVTIKWGCNDSNGTANSGCKVTDVGNKTYSTTIDTSTVSQFNIEDKAGNKTTCNEKTVNVYVDTTKPVCGNQTPGTETKFVGGAVSIACTDEHSKCEKDSFSKDFEATDREGIITIKDKAGNTEDCDIILSTMSGTELCNIPGTTLFGTSLGSQITTFDTPRTFEYNHRLKETTGETITYKFDNQKVVQNYLPLANKKYGFAAKWNQAGWCNADGTSCGYTRYCYPRVCSNPESCGVYLGYTADRLNYEFGCSFARCWCSCSSTGDWANQ